MYQDHLNMLKQLSLSFYIPPDNKFVDQVQNTLYTMFYIYARKKCKILKKCVFLCMKMYKNKFICIFEIREPHVKDLCENENDRKYEAILKKA